MHSLFIRLDNILISFFRKISIPFARGSLFIVFFGFGFLKLIGLSPAEALVGALLQETLPFIAHHEFMWIFALYEMAIGISFVIPKAERLAIALLLPHMMMTFLPLLLLPEYTWSMIGVPTLTGQYIIKNVIIVALATGIAAHLHKQHI